MPLDLVSPWCAAVEAGDPAMLAFHQLHTPLLESLRLVHAPHLDIFPLETDPVLLRSLSAIATSPVLRDELAAIASQAAALTGEPAGRAVLLAGGTILEPFAALPIPDPLVLLPLTAEREDTGQLAVRFARGLGLLTRWRATDSASAARKTDGRWNPWDLARVLPLREWIYAHGVAWHLAHALRPALAPHTLFGVSVTAWQRLREREGSYRTLLTAELDRQGMSSLLRWLPADGRSGPRDSGVPALPPRMGHYLAWRLTAPRVARVGLSAALRDDASDS